MDGSLDLPGRSPPDGDPRASPGLRQMLVPLLPRLRRFARGLTGSAADAEDLVQSACEKALASESAWQPGTRLDSWMYRILQNLWIDSRRALAARTAQAGDTVAEEPSLDGGRAVEARFALAAVRRAMALLPDDQRTILLLACVEGLSYRECAQVLEIPVGTVMSRLARARLTLSRLVDR